MKETTRFIRQNRDWNAEPNAPHEEAHRHGSDLLLSFFLNPSLYGVFKEGDKGCLRFRSCSRYRFLNINDEAWYSGKCRFSGLAPEWGEFYEIAGDFKESLCQEPWCSLGKSNNRQRNFLFYFRDRAFECSACDWIFENIPENALLT